MPQKVSFWCRFPFSGDLFGDFPNFLSQTVFLVRLAELRKENTPRRFLIFHFYNFSSLSYCLFSCVPLHFLEPKVNNISAAELGEKNNVEKAELVIKATNEDKDDLISQIEAELKDKPSLSQNSEDDISKSSADDFLKAIDEHEKEDKSNGEVVKKAPEEPTQPEPVPEPEPESKPENNKIEEKPSNIEEISSDSVAVVEESGKEESKRSEAMSVDNSEGSSDDVMEVDGELDNKPSEKMDVVEEKPVESIDVDLEESPKPQDVEIKDAQQNEINDVEIKEVSPETNDVEIKEISDDSNDVEIVENSEKDLDVEQKMKELHEGEKTATPAKDVSELSVEEQVKQLESIAHPHKEDEKPSEAEEKQKDTDGEFLSSTFLVTVVQFTRRLVSMRIYEL